MDADVFQEAGHKVTICHSTGSATNPYVVIAIDLAAVDGAGTSDHTLHNSLAGTPAVDGNRPAGTGPIGDLCGAPTSQFRPPTGTRAPPGRVRPCPC